MSPRRKHIDHKGKIGSFLMPKYSFTIHIVISMLFMNSSIACSTRFPTYQAVQACCDEENGRETINQYKSYQPDEIKRIMEEGRLAFKLSLGIQQSNNDGGNFLWQMINGGAKDPALFSAFLSICIMQDISEDTAYNKFSNFSGYSTIIKSFMKISPNNSLPYYLDAYFKYERQDYENGNRALIEGSHKQYFSDHSKEIFNYAAETSKFLSYPRFLAFDIALDNAVTASSPLVFKRLADLVFKQNNPSIELVSYVFHLGEQIENESFMLISKLVGNSLKMRSLKYQGKNTDALQEWHTSMLDIYNDYLSLSRTFDENQLYLYFDKVLETNELNAMKSVINNP